MLNYLYVFNYIICEYIQIHIIMEKSLFIGLRGLAGSGKDTCANFLSFILDNYDLSAKEGWVRYNAIVNSRKVVRETLKHTYVIAFADQLKSICAQIFGVPIDAFYNGNKANAWICINKDFAYTETKPSESSIMTAREFAENPYQASNNPSVNDAVWMSIREVMVYVGCYVLQSSLTRNIFVNIVNKSVNEYSKKNDLKYVICTDVRFEHELNYVRNMNGIMINITSKRVSGALNNIAEQSLDDGNDYDYTIHNDGTYEDLFNTVWNIVHENEEFYNEIVSPICRSDDANNYLRYCYESEEGKSVYRICCGRVINRIEYGDTGIKEFDPSGGPSLRVGETINGYDNLEVRDIFEENGIYYVEIFDCGIDDCC